MSKVCIIGMGYIGLPTAAIAAKYDHDVVGVDINQHAVDTINSGNIHIIENGLETIVRKAVANGKLKAQTTPEAADIFMLAVPTPITENKQPQLSYVEAAARAIAPYVSRDNLIILESTSPVGTTEKIAEWIEEERGTIDDLHFVHCPERVLPGRILEELENNDRIIGGITPKAAEKAVAFYKTFVKGECLKTTAKLAEMSKLTENAFRDINIAFANELSMICDVQGMDVWKLIRLANHHPRVNILQPGAGVGGHCIAVDPWFIVAANPHESALTSTARKVNDSKPNWVIAKIEQAANMLEGTPTIACLGLTFKPNIDDLRESPALNIVEKLAKSKLYNLLVAEPHIKKLPNVLKAVENTRLTTVHEAVAQADIILILVKHSLFLSIDIPQGRTIDCCGLLQRDS